MVPRSAIRTRFERPLSITLYSSVMIGTCVVGGALHAQEPPPRWAARAAIGASWMHDDDGGTAVTVHVIRGTDANGHVRIEGGLLAGPEYGCFDAGVELDVFPRSPVTLFLGAGGGILGEDGYGGAFGRASVGIGVVLASRYVLRGSAQGGVHGGERGPNLVMLGLEARFGAR